MTPRRKPKHKTTLVKKEFDIDLTLLGNRQLILFEEINEESAQRIVKSLYALDTLNHKPIMLYIDSPGGSCSSGLSIINAMKTIESPVVTIIHGEACSMAGYISIAGTKRVCYNTSNWMAHDLETEFEGTSLKIKDRAEYIEKYANLLDIFLRKHTKLNDKEIFKARVGELWLFADEMKEKGIVDEIYKY